MLLSQEILPDMALIHILIQGEDAGSLAPKINVLPLGQYVLSSNYQLHKTTHLK